MELRALLHELAASRADFDLWLVQLVGTRRKVLCISEARLRIQDQITEDQIIEAHSKRTMQGQ